MPAESQLHVLADRWRTIAASLKDLDQQSVARRIQYDVDVYEALADELDAYLSDLNESLP